MNDLMAWIVIILLIAASSGKGDNAGINWRYDGVWHNLYLFKPDNSNVDQAKVQP